MAILFIWLPSVGIWENPILIPLTVFSPPWDPARPRRIWKRKERSVKRKRWGKSQDALPWSPTSLVGADKFLAKNTTLVDEWSWAFQAGAKKLQGTFWWRCFFVATWKVVMWHVTFSICTWDIFFSDVFFYCELVSWCYLRLRIGMVSIKIH